jgi:transposase
MKIALDLDIRFKDGILIINSSYGTLIFPKDHAVQRKIQMVTLAELSDLSIEQICKFFHYKTRKSYYDIRRCVLENRIEALLPKKPGPKTAPKRTAELEKRVIQLRLSTEKNMYEMTRTLNQEGFSIRSRLVAQILSDYGISKKKSPPKSSWSALEPF